MTATGSEKLITCVLPKGAGMAVVEALRADKNIVAANVNHARGAGSLTPTGATRVRDQQEKEILTVVVAASRADELFRYLFERAGIDRPHGGLMYQSDLARSTPFVLPDLPEEK